MIDEINELLENFDDENEIKIENYKMSDITRWKKKECPELSRCYQWNFCNFKIDLPLGYDDTVQYPNGDPLFQLQDVNKNQNFFRLPQHRYSLFKLLNFKSTVDLSGGKGYSSECVDVKNQKFQFYYESILNPEPNMIGHKNYVNN